MDKKVEALSSQWESLQNELITEIKKTEMYKSFTVWRIEKQDLIQELNNLKEDIKEYPKLLLKIEQNERLCNEESYNRKPWKKLKQQKQKKEDYMIEEKKERLREIYVTLWDFVEECQIKLEEFGITYDVFNLITANDDNAFLRGIVDQLSYFISIELESKVKNREMLAILKNIEECRIAIGKVYSVRFPNESMTISTTETKIDRLKNDYVKDSNLSQPQQYSRHITNVYDF